MPRVAGGEALDLAPGTSFRGGQDGGQVVKGARSELAREQRCRRLQYTDGKVLEFFLLLLSRSHHRTQKFERPSAMTRRPYVTVGQPVDSFTSISSPALFTTGSVSQVSRGSVSRSSRSATLTAGESS